MHMYDSNFLQPWRFQALPSWDDDICFRLQKFLDEEKHDDVLFSECALWEF